MRINLLLRQAGSERLLTRLVSIFLLVSILSLTFGCDDSNNNAGGDSGDPLQADIDTTPPDFLVSPALTMGPNPDTPLAGLLEIQTDEPTRVSVTIAEAPPQTNSILNRGFNEPKTIDFEGFSTSHSLPVLGFTPDDTFIIDVTITDESLNKRVLDQPIMVITGPLPVEFPIIDAQVNEELVEPGVTLITLRPFGTIDDIGTYLAIINNQGDVIWYHKPGESSSVTDLRRISNGNILFIQDDTTIKEIDMLGNVISEFHSLNNGSPSPESILINTDGVHHEVFEKTDGNFLVLGLEARIFDNYPSSESDPFAPKETAAVVGDEVLEYSPEGVLINRWQLLDIIDPFRIAYNSLAGLWNWVYPQFENGTRDWSHGNAVIHDITDNSIIVSLRHQDAVVKFSAETGELIWILGPHENWDQEIYGEYLLTPIGDNFVWQYHQHAPMITPMGTLIIFDNGNFRASPFDEMLPASDNFSRAVEYMIDEETMEVMQVWEYGQFAEEILYTPFIGDADYLPNTGNILITFGGVSLDEEGMATDNIGTSDLSARIIEVTHDSPAEKVLDILISDKQPATGKGWITYRSQKLTELYP